MALHDPLPLPPELAAEHPPITDPDLETLLDAIVELADEQGCGVPAAAAELAADTERGYRAARWAPSDDSGAEWAMRHLVAANIDLGQLEAQAAEWAERIQAWFQHRARPLQAKVALFDGLLCGYALDVRTSTAGKVKSVTLPSGLVRTTSTPALAVVADPDVLLAWAHRLPPAEQAELVKVVHIEEVQVSKLRQATVVVEVVDAWQATLTCGCVTEVRNMPLLEAGTGMVCPECGQEALVGRLAVVAAHREVHDTSGRVVPGTGVREPTVTPKVVPDVP